MIMAFDLHEIGTLVSIALSVLALLSIGYTVSVRMAKLELKVETIWDFLVRRAFSEAVEKGVAKMNSPVSITPEARNMMGEMIPILQYYYKQEGYKLSDGELMLDIERRFGDDLLRLVCLPNKLDAGACLIMALMVAKEINPQDSDTLSLPLQKGDSGIWKKKEDI